MTAFDYSALPEHIRNGARAYVENHRVPGGFLISLFQNDLVSTVGKADEENLPRLREIVQWLYNEPPSICWGSREKVRRWLAGKEE